MVLVIVVFALVLVEMAMLFFSLSSAETNQSNYKRMATNLSETVAQVVNVDDLKAVKSKVAEIVSVTEPKVTADQWGTPEWKEYSAKFDAVKQMAEYNRLLSFLSKMQEANNDVDCLNLVYVDPQTEYCTYLVDSETKAENQCPPGCLDVLLEENRILLTNPEVGFPAFISNTPEYGWLVTAGSPIYDGETVVGYVLVDYSMNIIRANQTNRILTMFISLLGTTLLLSVAVVVIVHFVLIRPINRLNTAAKSYKSSDHNQSHEVFQNLKINTHDEIAELADSMKDLENDVFTTIDELTKTNRALSESQQVVEEMTELATTDALTGVRNKTSYDKMAAALDKAIQNGKKPKFAIVMIDLNYLKEINDDYGHDSGNSAIINLCGLICRTFAHSPVYRVGGDEFVAVLQGHDYESGSQLVSSFNRAIEEIANNPYLDPSEKASAAIGMACYDPDIDSGVKTVFKRADRAMYRRKHEMKGEPDTD